MTTASAEIKWMNGWFSAVSFDGEFSPVTRSCAGKGEVRLVGPRRTSAPASWTLDSLSTLGGLTLVKTIAAGGVT